MNNGIVRVKEKGIKKILDWSLIEFNSKVKYKNKTYIWKRMFRLHSNQIRNYVDTKVRSLDYNKPIPTL